MEKRALPIPIMLVCTVIVFNFGVAETELQANITTFSGEGTQANPYQINTIDDLKSLRGDFANYDKHFILITDLIFKSDDYENSVVGWSSIGTSSQRFTGTFDGNSKTIHNLFINRPDTQYIGLFGYFGGNITALRLENVTVNGNDYTGGLVGWNQGNISYSSVSGNLNGDDYIGGLVGWNQGEISYSLASANVSGDWFIGGLVGTNKGRSIYSSASGNVNGTRYTGGLIGNNLGQGHIAYSLASGTVSGVHFFGDFVGRNLGTIIYYESLAITSPVDAFFEKGAQNMVNWTIIGSGGIYTIYKNGSALSNNLWTPNALVSTNLTGLNVGTYNYTVVCIDNLGYSISDTVFVTISSQSITSTSTTISTNTTTSMSISTSTSTTQSTSSTTSSSTSDTTSSNSSNTVSKNSPTGTLLVILIISLSLITSTIIVRRVKGSSNLLL